MEEFSRLALLLKDEDMKKIHDSHVIVFGIGGVGGYAVEGLVRCGINNITIVDNDVVSLSNINRQIIALHSTINRYKVDVMEERIKDINPNVNVYKRKDFILKDENDDFDFSQYDYVVDAIDTVTGKLTIIKKAKAAHVKVISSMGTGNKFDISKLKVTDIYQTENDPLAKIMRKECRNLHIDSLKVVYSNETPISLKKVFNEETNKVIPGSNAFVPPVAGLMIAREVIIDLINEK